MPSPKHRQLASSKTRRRPRSSPSPAPTPAIHGAQVPQPACARPTPVHGDTEGGSTGRRSAARRFPHPKVYTHEERPLRGVRLGHPKAAPLSHSTGSALLRWRCGPAAGLSTTPRFSAKGLSLAGKSWNFTGSGPPRRRRRSAGSRLPSSGGAGSGGRKRAFTLASTRGREAPGPEREQVGTRFFQEAGSLQHRDGEAPCMTGASLK
jgi:hypothetical protein